MISLGGVGNCAIYGAMGWWVVEWVIIADEMRLGVWVKWLLQNPLESGLFSF